MEEGAAVTFTRNVQEYRERRAAERAANLQALATVPAHRLHRGVYADCGELAAAQPKEPHIVDPHIRNLARGEACTGLLYGTHCNCDPATTVWAHSNALAHGKGMGRKASDQHGAFLGFECHAWLDQGKASAEEKASFFASAHIRSRDRLAEIATDPAGKPWRRAAAQRALDSLKGNS